MRVKITTINKWIVYITMACALSLLKPIGEIVPVFAFDYAVRWANILLIVCGTVLLVITSKDWLSNKYIWGMAFFVCVSLLLRLGLDFAQGRNVYKELNAHSPYLYIILAVSVYYLLDKNVISLSELIDVIILLTMLSYVLRASISMVYTFSGNRIFYSIELEGAPSG